MAFICSFCNTEFGREIDLTSHKFEHETQIIFSPTFIEVCAGCGGLSSGLIKAGLAPILLVAS